MSHRYIPLTEQDKNEMLNSIGAKSISELFDDIPTDILLKRNLNIAESEAETILLRRLNRLAAKNTTKERSERGNEKRIKMYNFKNQQKHKRRQHGKER